MTIRTLIFDFGNVVGHFSHRRAFDRLLAGSPLTFEAVQGRVLGGSLEDDY